MVDIDQVRSIAMGYDEASEDPHFEKTSFRVRKKIFATLDGKKLQLVLKLSLEDQALYSSHDVSIISPVPGAWGRNGWTTIFLQQVQLELLNAMMKSAYCEVAPGPLSKKYK